MRVGIIDSGINAWVMKSKIVQRNFTDSDISGDMDRNGHGTMTAKVIETYSKRKINIISAKIFDERLQTSLKVLYDALDYMSNQNLNLLNMSVSIATPMINSKIKGICEKMLSQGTKIIASCSNNSHRTALEEIDKIITVNGRVFKNGERYWYNDVKMEAMADKSPVLVQNSVDQYKFYNGNSKATAIFSTRLINCFDEKHQIFDMKKLMAGAEKYEWSSNAIKCSEMQIPYGRINDSIDDVEDINIDNILLEAFKIKDISIIKENYWTHPSIGICGDSAFKIIRLIENRYGENFERKDIFLDDFLSYTSFKSFLKRNRNREADKN